MLGKGKEIFGLQHSLGINAPPMCLPGNSIDILLHELQHHQVCFNFTLLPKPGVKIMIWIRFEVQRFLTCFMRILIMKKWFSEIEDVES